MDSKTQKKVIESIDDIDRKITVFIVSHRLEAIENCDKVIKLEAGKLKSISNKNDII